MGSLREAREPEGGFGSLKSSGGVVQSLLQESEPVPHLSQAEARKSAQNTTEPHCGQEAAGESHNDDLRSLGVRVFFLFFFWGGGGGFRV